MEQAVLWMLVMVALGIHYRCASGFPVYDYDPSSLREALSASVAKVNSQSMSPYLFRDTRSSLKRVNVLDEDTLVMNLEFSVRETKCPRDSNDPSTCTFQRGYYAPTAACRSTVQMFKGQVKDVWAHCRWASTSESTSSEEIIFGDTERSYRRRNDYLLGFLSDESRSEQFYDRSLEILRRGHLPAHKRFLNLHHRARVNSGFE
ncbi:secreted phosphoprotein 24 [Psammomys obesus]|uniref:secreted phosphoprotein 24 n=1 Tax=Psammomys obesus TaxID=48139 RepID=UPI002453173C|nr:secreted phosphoprotein 24 [Psammomys obesus]XP_055472630.1 secreted phosphoprotein 24 [Psammomys obesus]